MSVDEISKITGSEMACIPANAFAGLVSDQVGAFDASSFVSACASISADQLGEMRAAAWAGFKGDCVRRLRDLGSISALDFGFLTADAVGMIIALRWNKFLPHPSRIWDGKQ